MLAATTTAPADPFRLVEQHHNSALGRWTLVVALPTGPLAELVEAVWASRGAGVFTQEEILPRTPTEVLFALGETHWLRDRRDSRRDRAYTRAFVSGLQRSPLAVESPADSEMAGIRLRPAGAGAFLRDSPSGIAGAVIDLDALLGSGVESLRDRLASLRDLRARTLALAAAAARHLAAARRLAAPLRFALGEIERTRGTAPIASLVAASGWSHRHFAARFRDEIGLTPKAFARIARFEAAFARLQTIDRVNWPEFALDCGYFDQAHLIREFGELAGATPTDVFRRRAPDGLGLLSEEETERTQRSPSGGGRSPRGSASTPPAPRQAR